MPLLKTSFKIMRHAHEHPMVGEATNGAAPQRAHKSGMHIMWFALNILVLSIVAMHPTDVQAQNELIVGQYMHNTFAVNPAFAGSRDCMSLFGSFRKQWVGIESTPMSALISANTPLRNESVVLGASIYHQQIRESRNSGALLTVGYRANVINNSTWLGFALQPGVALRARDWTKLDLMDPDDLAFAEKTSNVAPLLGFGVSLYGPKFFAGISTTSFFVSNDFDKQDAEFAPGDATWVLTGGYWFDLGKKFALQPSVLADYNKQTDFTLNGTVSAIYKDMIWLSVAYRTNKEMTFGAAFLPVKRFRIAYNYSMSMGDLKSYNSGSHEISLQYDFLYHVKTVGHRFY